MKEKIKYAVARCSLWLSVAAFAVFVVALLSAAYNVVLWAGAVSLVSFCLLLGVSSFYTSDEMNRNYVNHCRR